MFTTLELGCASFVVNLLNAFLFAIALVSQAKSYHAKLCMGLLWDSVAAHGTPHGPKEQRH
jgi:hypothetical protein